MNFRQLTQIFCTSNWRVPTTFSFYICCLSLVLENDESHCSSWGLRKIDLFKGSIGKNGEGVFKGLRQKNKPLLPFNKGKQFFSYWKRGNNNLVILKELSCVIFKRLWSDPQILCFNFWFFVLFEAAIKKIPPKKTSKSAQINTIFVHFICSFYMWLVSCKKYKGNLFSTEIWVSGSYGDALLNC